MTATVLHMTWVYFRNSPSLPSVGSNYRFRAVAETSITRTPVEKEQSHTFHFEVALKSYGRRSKLRQELALRLCRLLYVAFGQVDVCVVRETHPTETHRIIYHQGSEGGSVEFPKKSS